MGWTKRWGLVVWLKPLLWSGLWPAWAGAAAAQSAAELKAGFERPPIQYHTVPAWWWDGGDPVEPARLDWQLEQLKSQGLNVVSLIQLAPLALRPPYYSEKWWSLVEHTARKAASLDMRLWISDGIGWGSPLINNTVVEEDASYLGQILAHVEGNVQGPQDFILEIPTGLEVLSVLGAYGYRWEAGQLSLTDPLDLSAQMQGRRLFWQAPEGQWTAMIFYAQPGIYQPRTNFGGFLGPGRGQPLDYMNPRAMKRLLDVTVGEYERRLEPFIGSTVVGTFQDELLTTHGFPPFSPLFPEAFQKWKGYPFLPALAALFREAGPLTPKVRCDYFDVWVRLLEEAYFKPQYQWYQDRNMVIAHDQFGRGTLLGQVRAYGDYFRTMRWYQAPGVDDWHEARPGRNLRDIKLASSIAHLYRRPHVFSEALHTAGWGLTMEQQRQVVNEEYVMGVNLYDEVLFKYTTHNSWFEWAPADTMFRQPYFRHKRLFNDYVHRLSYILSQGVHVADVAVLYPVTSLQAEMTAGGTGRSGELINAVFFQLMESLFYAGIDFDVIDEESVQQASAREGRLSVAGEAYRAVVLPPLTALHQETALRIAEFAGSGGLVVGMTRIPTDSPQAGRNDPRLAQLMGDLFGSGGGIFLEDGFKRTADVLHSRLDRDFVSDTPGVLANHRRTSDRDIFWIYNSTPRPVRAGLRLRVAGRPEIWNPETGHSQPHFDFQIEQGRLKVHLPLDPHEGRLLVIQPGESGPALVAPGLEGVNLSTRGDTLTLEGRTSQSGGSVEAIWKGRAYSAPLPDRALPGPIRLDPEWSFSVEPTLDNQWGDFRLPVTPENRWIGPEIRRFRYRQEEAGEDGLALGWASSGLDAPGWEEAVYTVGPYWWIIRPFPTRGGAGFFQQSFISETDVDVKDSYRFRDRVLKWEKYSFSQDFGIHRDQEHYRAFGAAKYININSEFFDLGPIESFSVAYAYTHVHSPQAGNALLETNAASYMEPFRIWVNGEPVSDRYLLGPIGQMQIQLRQGWNTLLVKLMQYPMQGPKRMRFYVRLTPESQILNPSPPPSGPQTPRVPGFSAGSPYLYDVEPESRKRIGWYEFRLPPGTSRLHLDLRGRARAFLAGVEVPVTPNGELILPQPSGRDDSCILRVEQEIGRYAGAAFRSPIRVEISRGGIGLGDWSNFGLDSYSGIGIYSQSIRLPAPDAETGWVLDLGQVHTAAEVRVNGRSAGARAWPPYRFDVTEFLKPGSNTLEVRVANTLANHGLTGTAWMFIYEGAEGAGLLGPVSLTPYRKLSLDLK